MCVARFPRGAASSRPTVTKAAVAAGPDEATVPGAIPVGDSESTRTLLATTVLSGWTTGPLRLRNCSSRPAAAR
eukprot:1181875-Prorocentrum_minimum.AAC.1